MCRSWAVDGSSGSSRGHALVLRRPGSRWGGAVERPYAFQAGHIPSWRESSEIYALPTLAADSGWLLLLLSPLLSAAGPGPHVQGLTGAVTAPCPGLAEQAAPPARPVVNPSSGYIGLGGAPRCGVPVGGAARCAGWGRHLTNRVDQGSTNRTTRPLWRVSFERPFCRRASPGFSD